MPTAETAPTPARRWVWPALALVLAGALALRLWGVRQGLPYAYNSDENAHFLARAIGMFGHSLNPEYFANPPAFTYLLHLLLVVWFGGTSAVGHAYAAHPAEVWTIARVSVAVLGTLAVWLLYLTGARLFGRGVGLLAAALEAVAFLPVFYSHLALNDVPTLAPLTLSLLGSAGVARRGRMIDYLLAGIGLGLGCATKYTAGIVLVPLCAAAAAHYLQAPPGQARRVLLGIAAGGACALAAFIAANPYAVLDFSAFHGGIAHQSSVSSEAQGKLGAPKESGIFYYLWSLSWGLGWAPSLAALGGAFTVWRASRAAGWMLVPAPLLFLAFMGLQSRYFGRWLMPILPILCLLAAQFALTMTAWLRRLAGTGPLAGRPFPRAALGLLPAALLAVGLCAQGAVYSIHSGRVLARSYTTNLAREWMLAHIPAGTPIVLEPIAPADWVAATGRRARLEPSGEVWRKYPSLRSVIGPSGALEPDNSSVVNIEDYEKTLAPALIGYYQRLGYCWVITGSTQYGRATADPGAVPLAIAYYRALKSQGQLAYHLSPFGGGTQGGRDSVPFNFDWTFDYYPLAYRLPGPEINIYRLAGGRCANSRPAGQRSGAGVS